MNGFTIGPLKSLQKITNPYFKSCVFITSILLLSYSNLIFAQTDSIQGSTKIDKKYLVSYWKDTKSIVKEPLHWKGKQWSIFAGIVGIGVVTYVYDEEIYDFFQLHRTTTSDNISKYLIEPWGSGLYSLPLLAGIYIAGSKDSRHRRIALTGVKAFILSGGAVIVTKHLFHRHRPSDDSPPNPGIWDGPFPFTTNYTSFPSGHTTTAFAVASVLASGYKDKLWVGVTSYTIASLVGLSRIHDGHHWASDAVAGAALGSFIGLTLSKLNFKKVQVSPTAMYGGMGVSFTYLVY